MGYFERRFVRPTHLQIVDALEEAARKASELGQHVEQNREDWSAFVTDIRSQVEGCHQWISPVKPLAGLVGIAWWTDFLGRRHFRIWGGSAGDDSFHREDDSRPPLWHIAPGRVFGRKSQAGIDWLPVCACGMTGAPQAIGWVGDRCGMCHHISAEAPTEAPVRLSSFREAGHALKRLEFSPDGRWLAGAGGSQNVHVWDVAAGLYHGSIRHAHGETNAVAFTPDSQFLAIAGRDRMLRFVRVATGAEVAAFPAPNDVSQIAIAPDNLTLAMVGNDALEIWGRAKASLPWLLLVCESINAWSVAFNRSGDQIVAGGTGKLELWSIPERGGQLVRQSSRTAITNQYRDLAFSGDDHWVVAVEVDPSAHSKCASHRIRWWEVNRFCDLGSMCSRALVRVATSQSRFSPGGNWLATGDGNAVTLESVWLEGPWFKLMSDPLAKLTATAFSPDGHTLASADVEGAVKLWPWRRLIEA